MLQSRSRLPEPTPDQHSTGKPVLWGSAAAPVPRGSAPVAASRQAAVVAESGDALAILGQLSMELRKYVSAPSVPKNFEEFIAKSQVQAPAPPAGKKYAIQNQAVVLVKR